MKKQHWDKYYKKNLILKPSSFARFCIKYIKKNKNIIDIGSGSGRDTFFFFKKGTISLGIDFSKSAIEKCNFLSEEISNKYLKFKCLNTKNINFKEKFDYIYCRFFIHAINKSEENILLNKLKIISKKNTFFFFEFRTVRDPLIKKGKKISENERVYGHYRRFIEPENFLSDFLKKIPSKIIFSGERKNLSKIKGDNPSLYRLILKRI